jgi:hypothetical protein
MSTLDKQVYDRLYKTIKQVVLDYYLTSNERRWRGFYKLMSAEGLSGYEEILLKDPQVSVEINRRDCEHIKVLIIIDTIL